MEFTLKSSAFKNHGLIPEKYTCDGESISPELEWLNSPKGTKSFTLIINDYGALGGARTHSIIYNIPSDIIKLDEGITTLAKKAVGLNSRNQRKYATVCPINSIHNYYFHLYALNKQLKYWFMSLEFAQKELQNETC